MTREAAIFAGARAAERFGVAQVVYRFKAWPPDVYGVRNPAELPREALTFERIEPPAVLEQSTQAPPPANSATHVPGINNPPQQGGLF